MARGPLSAMPDPGDVDPNDTDGEGDEDPKEEKAEKAESPGEAAAEDLSSAIAGGDAKEIWEAFKHCYDECKMSSDAGEYDKGGEGPKPGGLLAILSKKKA